MRVTSNHDLSVVDSNDEAASATSDELSANSETYDFLMVCMPFVRPKVLTEEELLEIKMAEEAAANKGKKGKKGATKRKSDII